MPRGNGAGPQGMGAMTGRGAGYCAGTSVAGYMTPVAGRGCGRGMGPGRARGRGMRSDVQSEFQGLDLLKSQAEWMKDSLKSIESRVSDLERGSDS